jgi:trans-aconitate 2-methyltransferase
MYDSLPLPQTLWGRRTLARLDPSGVRRVLDAGCGAGRDTEPLLDLISHVRVVAVDASRAMLDQLERRVPDFVAECGGEGNVASIVAAIDDLLGESPAIWNFAGVEETEQRLQDAGFTDVEVGLIPDPARFEKSGQFERYVTLALGAHLERLPEPERPAFAQAVTDRLSNPVVDHVRLTLRAKKRD